MEIKLRILEKHYNRRTARHLKQDKILELIAEIATRQGEAR